MLPAVDAHGRAGDEVGVVGEDFPEAMLADPEMKAMAEEELASLKQLAADALGDGFRVEVRIVDTVREGVLPRKTFSMGEAHEKRFYVEARRIR